MIDAKKARREKLHVMAMNIRDMEARIAELKKEIPLQVHTGVKGSMQKSLKFNTELLKSYKEAYWKEEKYEH